MQLIFFFYKCEFLKTNPNETNLLPPDSEVEVPEFVRAWQLLDSSLVDHVDDVGLGVDPGVDVSQP